MRSKRCRNEFGNPLDECRKAARYRALMKNRALYKCLLDHAVRTLRCDEPRFHTIPLLDSLDAVYKGFLQHAFANGSEHEAKEVSL